MCKFKFNFYILQRLIVFSLQDVEIDFELVCLCNNISHVNTSSQFNIQATMRHPLKSLKSNLIYNIVGVVQFHVDIFSWSATAS